MTPLKNSFVYRYAICNTAFYPKFIHATYDAAYNHKRRLERKDISKWWIIKVKSSV